MCNIWHLLSSLYDWKPFESCFYHDRWWSKRNIEFYFFSSPPSQKFCYLSNKSWHDFVQKFFLSTKKTTLCTKDETTFDKITMPMEGWQNWNSAVVFVLFRFGKLWWNKRWHDYFFFGQHFSKTNNTIKNKILPGKK